MLTSDPPAAFRQTKGAATWSRVTHRAGWILKAKQTNPSGLPPDDPEAKWTEAAREWSRDRDEDDNPLPRESARGVRRRRRAISENRTGRAPAGGHPRQACRAECDGQPRAIQQVRPRHPAQDWRLRRQSPPQKLAVRFDPGPIVDLPSFVVYKENKEVASGRLCMTVCMNESRSKRSGRASRRWTTDIGAPNRRRKPRP